MKFGSSEDDDVRLVVDDDEFDYSSSCCSSQLLCRICHEEEDESSTTMETPCACSGTLKFAHRGCIQRWCDEKGSTTCEICLQNFEPGYTVPPMLALLDIAVTIRGSLEVPRHNYDSHNQGLIHDEPENDYPDCSPSTDRSATCFRSISLILMLLLLVRHIMDVLSAEEGDYPFALATVLLLRASGILVPFYFMLKIVSVIQKGQQRQERLRLQLRRRDASTIEENEELPQVAVQIQS